MLWLVCWALHHKRRVVFLFLNPFFFFFKWLHMGIWLKRMRTQMMQFTLRWPVEAPKGQNKDTESMWKIRHPRIEWQSALLSRYTSESKVGSFHAAPDHFLPLWKASASLSSQSSLLCFCLDHRFFFSPMCWLSGLETVFTSSFLNVRVCQITHRIWDLD